MTLVNTDYISGKELETLGLVKGSTIRAKHLGNDIVASLKMIVGGELTEYGDMINEARAIATKRMVDEATALGADAVINVRYATSNVAKSAAEVLVYGTAIKYI
ncbi:MAG: YbjQ family protein [Spirochaetia bacterium]|nr:YbjQ family protein [Spirochaetia bacterium]MCF7949341.1 YbjQ family protein [Spirochaetia bacterium]